MMVELQPVETGRDKFRDEPEIPLLSGVGEHGEAAGRLYRAYRLEDIRVLDVEITDAALLKETLNKCISRQRNEAILKPRARKKGTSLSCCENKVAIFFYLWPKGYEYAFNNT
jgi:hypothetical protein